MQLDPGETGALLEAHALADAAGEREDATRALGNLGYVLMSWAMPEPALRYAQRALAYAETLRGAHVRLVRDHRAGLAAPPERRLGRGGADRRAGEIERGITVVQLLAKTVLAELAVRRGDADARERVADLAAHADRAGEPQRIAPVIELATELALTAGGPVPGERFEQLAEQMRAHGGLPRPLRGPAGRMGGRGRDRHRRSTGRRPARTPP